MNTEFNIYCDESRHTSDSADRYLVKHDLFNDGDKELGFYKLYYQTLVHWLEPGQTYHVYLDWQQNACQERFADLRQILRHKLSGRAKVACLEPVSSHELPLLQLTDLLIGAVGYAWNQRDTSKAKLGFCEKKLTWSSSMNQPPHRSHYNLFPPTQPVTAITSRKFGAKTVR